MGVSWAVVWGAIFAGLSIVIGVFDPDSIDPGEGPLRTGWIGGVYGFVSGVVFSALLAMSEGRKTLRNLSVGKAALWGAIGAAAFPLLTTVNDSMVILVSPIGAALAAGTVALAKRAELSAGSEQSRLTS